MIGQEAIGAAPVQAAGRADVPGGDAGSTITRRTLENGTTAIVRENRAAPVVALTLLVEGGSAAETRGTSGVTALLGRVLLKGTRRRSALDIAQTAEDAGASSASEPSFNRTRAWAAPATSTRGPSTFTSPDTTV